MFVFYNDFLSFLINLKFDDICFSIRYLLLEMYLEKSYAILLILLKKYGLCVTVLLLNFEGIY